MLKIYQIFTKFHLTGTTVEKFLTWMTPRLELECTGVQDCEGSRNTTTDDLHLDTDKNHIKLILFYIKNVEI